MDGRRMVSDPRLKRFVHSETETVRPGAKLTSYQRVSIAGENVEYCLWVVDGLDPDSLLRVLFESYPGPK
jgi:hypothetical protein